MKKPLTGVKGFLHDRRFLLLSMAVSLALHTVVATGILGKKPSKPPRHEELVVELMGIVTNRQVEQKQRGDTNPGNTPKAVATPTKKVTKKVEKK